MKIEITDSFRSRVIDQLEFIAKDSPVRARKFQKELMSAIKNIPQRPLSYRKSIYFDNESIRDMIFKGYVIVFRINKENIQVFGFIKYQNKLEL